MNNYLKLIRLRQWIKNGFLFLPIFFDVKITDIHLLLNNIYGFISFSFVASAVYILNDYKDLEYDKLHPRKMNRPLAEGTVSSQNAFILMSGLLVAAFLIGLLLPIKFLIFTGMYFAINLLYSFRLKHISILDILLISIGFILRIFAGGAVTNITPSAWLIIMTFLLAIFMALAKRRDDVLLFEKSGVKARSVIPGYNIEFLNIGMSVMASVIIVAYLMYSLSPDVIKRFGTNNLYLSVIFVVLGILRYLQLAIVKKDTASPTDILYKDHLIQFSLLGWLITVSLILYFSNIFN